MRLPTAWNDKRLLEDEPFLSYFAARKAQPVRSKHKNKEVTSAICNELKGEIGGCKAAQAWLRMAFVGQVKPDVDSKKGPVIDAKKGVVADHITLRIFVEFYWTLFQEEKQAVSFLNRERKDRNFYYSIDSEPAPNPGRAGDNSQRKARGRPRKAKGAESTRPHLVPKEEVLQSDALTQSPSVPQADLPQDSAAQELPQNLQCKSSSFIEDSDSSLPEAKSCSSTPLKVAVDHSHNMDTNGEADILPSLDHTPPSLADIAKESDTGDVTSFVSRESPTGRQAEAEALPRSDVPASSNALKRPASKTSLRLSKRGVIADNAHPVSEMKQESFETTCSPSKRQRTDSKLAVGNVDVPGRKSKPRKKKRTPLSKPLASSAGNGPLNSSNDHPPETFAPVDAVVNNVEPSSPPLVVCTSMAQSPVSVAIPVQPSLLECPDILQTLNTSVVPATSVDSNPQPSQFIPQPAFPYVPIQPVTFPGIPKNEDFSRNWLAELASPFDDPPEIDYGEELKLFDSQLDLPNVGIYTHKEPLPLYPPIWAQSRQEVCESFGWFRSYQSGVYFSRNVVKGYLLSAFSARRDRFEDGGRLIISHGGGRAESIHTRQGETSTQQAEDQLAQDKSVRALLTNYRERRPLALVIDDKYVLFPYDLGVKGITYAVLGFYTIAHAWAEFQPASNERGRVVRYKFAFQWCEGQGDPWWIPNVDDATLDGSVRFPYRIRSSETVSASMTGSLPVKVGEYDLSEITPSPPREICSICPCCHRKSPQVYLQGWACLNPTCDLFWTASDGRQLPDTLDYNPIFLQLPPPLHLPIGYELLPSLPVPEGSDGITTNYAFSRGWHCKQCGRLSCRFKWVHWECMHCEASYRVPGKIRLAKEFWRETVPVGFRDHFIVASSKIIQLPLITYSHEKGIGQCQTFILPDGRGRIHHIQSGNPMGKLDADTIFREYQEQATSGELAFRRWPLRAHKCRGPLLTNYFSQNSGEPYQYVGGTANTVPFDQAPGAVVKARDLIQNRIRQALGKSATFNEVLSAAYMERQKMAFHSDNEIGLGPLVAGLSLGSPALMHFRLHAKHDPNKEHRGIIMSFVLRHGDVLVMDGGGVQGFYEHTVIPANFRIAATARFIDQNHA